MSTATAERQMCFLCGVAGEERIVRGMVLRRCEACDVVWLSSLLPSSYYRELPLEIAPGKMQRRFWNAEDRLALLQKQGVTGCVCDIGCGEGAFLSILRDRGGEAFGVEPNPAAVRFGRERGLDIIEGMVEDAVPLLRSRHPHAVTLFHVLEHLPDPIGSLRTLRASMDPGARLLLEVPSLDGYSARRLGDGWDLIYPEHLTLFSKRSLRRCVEAAGFRVIAAGRRDFDVRHMGVGELLFRLGFGRTKASASPSESGNGGGEKSHEGGRSAPRFRFVRATIQRVLAWIVQALGRVDYIWVIAVPDGGDHTTSHLS